MTAAGCGETPSFSHHSAVMCSGFPCLWDVLVLDSNSNISLIDSISYHSKNMSCSNTWINLV